MSDPATPSNLRHAITSALRLGLSLGLIGIVVFAGWTFCRQIPPQDLPWTPLSLEQPVGLSTHMKLRRIVGDEIACQAALSTAIGLQTRPAAPDAGTDACPLPNAVAYERGSVSYGGEFAASCSLAAALHIWEREVLAPAAQTYLGTSIARIDTIGSFACRNVYNRTEGRLSEHATANALDIAGFRLEDGRRVSVLNDWADDSDEGRFLNALVEGSCSIFSGVLTPAYNRAHRDHLHLDMGQYRICAEATTAKQVNAPTSPS